MNRQWTAQDAIHFIKWVGDNGGHAHIDCTTNNGQYVFVGTGRDGETLIESLQVFAQQFGLHHQGIR